MNIEKCIINLEETLHELKTKYTKEKKRNFVFDTKTVSFIENPEKSPNSLIELFRYSHKGIVKAQEIDSKTFVVYDSEDEKMADRDESLISSWRDYIPSFEKFGKRIVATDIIEAVAMNLKSHIDYEDSDLIFVETTSPYAKEQTFLFGYDIEDK